MTKKELLENKAFKEHLIKKGFIELNPGCMDFENVQPRFVYCFDYNGLSEDELMLTFKSDYRNRIRKAPKKGVEVKICGKEALDDFVRIMSETGERDGFSTRPKEYFAKILVYYSLKYLPSNYSPPRVPKDSNSSSVAIIFILILLLPHTNKASPCPYCFILSFSLSFKSISLAKSSTACFFNPITK